MPLVKILEDAALFTWDSIRDSIALDISQGEETITDNVLLNIARKKSGNVKIIKTPKDLESKKGTDWEWWIGSDSLGWIRYAIQAKKLYPKDNKYQALKHLVGKVPDQKLQHEILEAYSKANSAVPLYAFYNYIDLPSYEESWNCPLDLQKEQLGITVTTLSNVKKAIKGRGKKSFVEIHKLGETIPIRCLAQCPKIMSAYTSSAAKIFKFDETVRIFNKEEVSFLKRDNHPQSLDFFPSSLYSRDVDLYPGKILVMTLDK